MNATLNAPGRNSGQVSLDRIPLAAKRRHDPAVARSLKRLNWLIPERVASALPKVAAEFLMKQVLADHPDLGLHGFRTDSDMEFDADRLLMIDDDRLMQFVLVLHYFRDQTWRATINPAAGTLYFKGACERWYGRRRSRNGGAWPHVDRGIVIAAVLALGIDYERIPDSADAVLALDVDREDLDEGPPFCIAANENTKEAWAADLGIHASRLGDPEPWSRLCGER